MEVAAVRLQVNRKLADQVHVYLRTAILNNELSPGDRIVEADLSRRLGISRSPIREAMKRLEQEGLVVVARLRTVVREVPSSEVVEMFHIRTALEGMAAWLATTRLSETDLAIMDELCNKFEAAIQDPATSSDPKFLSTVGEEFHAVFLEACGNRRLQEALFSIKEHIHRYRPVSTARPGRSLEALRNHRDLLEAFRRRDADGAEHILRNHILSAAKALSAS